MRRAIATTIFLFSASLWADGNVSFRIGQREYQLSGAHAVLTQRNGKTQLVIGVKDTQQKVQFALTAELPTDLTGPMQLTPEIAPLSLVAVNTRGMYSFVPHTTLARDDFMRYIKKEEIATGELEDDPDDQPEKRLKECQQNRIRECGQLAKETRRKRPKVIVRYVKHGPTWVGKTREERIAQGDGVMVEEKYRDTSLTVRLTPVLVNGKITTLTGNFAGVVLYNEGLNSPVKVPLQAGAFSVTVQNTP